MTDDRQVPMRLMTSFDRWIVADETGKPIPGTAAADNAYWTNFDTAYVNLRDNPDAASMGVSFTGRVKLRDHYLLAIDFDSAIDDKGGVRPWAMEALESLPVSYTELSPSGRGLHVLLLCRKGEYDHGKRYIEVAQTSADSKAPQMQVFGGIDGSNYMRITGNVWGDRYDLAEVDDIDEFVGAFPIKASAKMADEISAPWTNSTIDKTELSRRVDEQLGELHRVGEKVPDYPSASEAYFKLLIVALRAAGGDGELVLEWLLDVEHTGSWAAGCVEWSVDPGKYAKPEWVENRVRKATGVTNETRPDWKDLVPAQPTQVAAEDEDELPLFMRPRQFRKAFSAPVPFMVENLVPSQGVVQIYGQPGHGKSCWALGLAYAVATGAESFFGYEVQVHGPALVLVGEDPHGVANRTAAQETLCEIEDEPQVYLSREPVPLTGDVKQLAAVVSQVRPKLVVVDTQIANAGDVDENDTAQMKKLMVTCEGLAQQANCVVLLVHHMAKRGEGARGSSVQTGAVVADFRAVRDGSGEGAVYRLEPGKAKNWAAERPIRTQVVGVEIGELRNGNPHTAPALDYRAAPWAPPADEEDNEGPTVGDLAADLQMLTVEHGALPRARVVELLNEAGWSLTVRQLRNQENSLQGQHLDILTARGANGGTRYLPLESDLPEGT